jgi:two-component system, LuxR family, response regulator FixJ
MSKSRICIIDDNEAYLEALASSLSREDYEVHRFTSPQAFLEAFRAGLEPDLILTDYKMKDMNGLELCAEIRQENGLVPVLIVSGWIDRQVALEAFAAGATDLLEKPLSLDQFMFSLQRALFRYMESSQQKERLALYEELDRALEDLSKNQEGRYTKAENMLLESDPKALSDRDVAPEFLRSMIKGDQIYREIEQIRQKIRALDKMEWPVLERPIEKKPARELSGEKSRMDARMHRKDSGES